MSSVRYRGQNFLPFLLPRSFSWNLSVLQLPLRLSSKCFSNSIEMWQQWPRSLGKIFACLRLPAPPAPGQGKAGKWSPCPKANQTLSVRKNNFLFTPHNITPITAKGHQTSPSSWTRGTLTSQHLLGP